MRIDLHIHTNASQDSIINAKTLIRKAVKAELDGFAVTDHNTTTGWKKVKNEAKNKSLSIIPGEEISIIRNGKKIGEIIGLFLNETVPKADSLEIIDTIKDQDGLIIIPHPFDIFRSHLEQKEIKKLGKRIHAIEVLNSRVIFPSSNEKALAIAHYLKLGRTAGSDAHTPWEIGASKTVADCDSIEEFRKLIKKRRTTTAGKTTNPIFHLISGTASLKNTILRSNKNNVPSITYTFK